MRIAIFEPYPRTCGVTKWAYELAPGFRALGHECDVVSFTKSGRPYATEARDGSGPRKGWRWWTQAPDVVESWDNSVDVLARYDLVVLNEPKNNPQDEESKKQPGTWPDYVDTLYHSPTPWITAFHDASAYRPSNAPFLADCFRSPSFSGTALQLRRGAYEAAVDTAGELPVKNLVFWPFLPYTVKGLPHVTPSRDRDPGIVLGMGGRMLSTKGFASLFSVGHLLPPNVRVTSFGAESGGMGPCPSFVMYETLVKHHGWIGVRGDSSFDWPSRSQASIDMGNYSATNMVAPWHLTHTETGNRMEYVGNYLDALEMWERCHVAVQLSTDKLVSTFEYTTLEAMNAGCLPILPRYYGRDMGTACFDASKAGSYSVMFLNLYREGVTKRKNTGYLWHDETERDELVHSLEAVASSLQWFSPMYNVEAMKRHNDPALLAAEILRNV